MKIQKIGYRFRIYPTKKQKMFLEKHFGCCRFIYNYLLNLHNEYYEKFKTNIFDLKKEIARLKKLEEFKWLKEVNSQSLQESSLDLIKALKRFFKKLSQKPRFKRKFNKQTFKIPQFFELRRSNRGRFFLLIPKLETEIRVNVHREVKGKIKQVTITKTSSGEYYVSLNCEYMIKRKNKINQERKTEVGIDLGLTLFITTSNGNKKEAPKFLRKSEDKLKSAQRALSKKDEFSSNWCKARKKVAVLYNKVGNQRKDFLHKISRELVNENQVIYLEDLNVKGMIKNRHLSKSIADAGWGEFTRQLTYKTAWEDKEVVQIGRFEPSSKLCSNCNYINKDLKLQDRFWECKSCLSRHDRDVNAAKNILRIGQGMSEFKPVEKPTSVFSFKRMQVDSVKQEPLSKL